MKKILSVLTVVTAFAMTAQAVAQQDDSIRSDRYIVSQEFVEAEVIRVKPIERTITVKGELRGETRKFTVPEGTKITVNGKEARLRHLRTGDTIRVSFAERAEKVVVNRIRLPDTDISMSVRRVAADPLDREAVPAMLPKTASFFPAILILGLMSFAGAVTFRRMRV